ncbi:chitobiase/beta-hexosaminidase C-terminal domain-containing protein, partial [Micromonospora sp. M51]|uniref:chitobiase/beta-hexosaminidase C-terminal domain-containing protein n=1 Tax=Micromonospora sp. M51 TaxID=2824889 RepID=UPI001FFCA3E1
MTTRNTGLPVAAFRAAGIAAATVFVAGLLVVSSPQAGAESVPAAQPVSELLAGAQTADAAAADDLTGDITFSVPSGTFQGEVAVTLGSTISGAQIRYTTNGQPPTAQSALYSGSALRFTRTTQLRAQAFVGQAPTGAPGTAMYAAQNVTTAHDLPVVLIDSYGAGRPDREYFDSTTMIF